MDEKYQQYCQDCPEMPRKHISTKKQIEPDQQLPSVSSNMVGKSPSITQWFSRFNDLNINLVEGLPIAIPPSFECRRSCPVRTGEMTQDSPEITVICSPGGNCHFLQINW